MDIFYLTILMFYIVMDVSQNIRIIIPRSEERNLTFYENFLGKARVGWWGFQDIVTTVVNV